ncbi:MAG: S8/S53 family peptidase [Ignavibacteriae bacterium]|nr:S8/S53 family peptidase [Ignavibacteria bacterium]MBI3364078.1 S8/S53 family peptidase [Ignavibacteriota bacterium]
MNDRKIFQDSVTPIHADQGLTLNGLIVNATKPEHRKEKMTLHFSLEIPPEAQARLEEAVARGEVVSPEELQKKYTPSPADVEKLVSWLKAEGFEILPAQHDGSSVYARASVAQIEKSLAVKTVRVTKEGITYTAAQNAPSLPAEVSKSVHAIIGLQPFRRAHKHIRMSFSTDENRLSLTPNDHAIGSPSPNIANSPPYLVPEVLKAYGADNVGVTGKGQTIAILIDTFPADKDLTAFWKANNVSCTLQQITKINVKGGHLPAPEGEETLDASWSSGVAPGANIRIYASGSLLFVDLDMALDRIIADLSSVPGMRQLSISLGLGEHFMGGANGEVATQHQKFLKLAAAGVNVFVSSGDAGSNPDGTGQSPTGPTQTEYASSDPCVVGVGGTSLTLAHDGSVANETGWVSGGGGKSIFFKRPSWQKGSGVPAVNHRLVPDVSVTADPNEGAFLVLHGHVKQYGGTSWSAPVWAGFCALINEARKNAGKPSLPFLNPLIYPHMGAPCFRDIKTGNNGAFNAGPGYDMVTGIGVPNIKELIQALTK